MDYSDYYLTASEIGLSTYIESQTPSAFISKTDLYKFKQSTIRSRLLDQFSREDNPFNDLINEHFDLECSPLLTDSSLGQGPGIAKEFYSRHIDTIKLLLKLYGNSDVRSKGATLMIDPCLLGIVSYCSCINDIDSNAILKGFIKSTDAIRNIALCKQLCTTLNELAIDTSIKHKIERAAAIIINAEAKVELYVAGLNSAYYKKIYEAAYPNMKNEGLFSLLNRVIKRE